MLKYITTATALKVFSSSRPAKQLYRALGNTLGEKKRLKGAMPDHYLKRINHMLRLNRRYQIIKDGDKLLELGTGWLHWDAVTARLFFDIEATLFDVWDNRQIAGFRNYITQLGGMLDDLDADQSQKNRARSLIAQIRDVTSFEALYDVLGFTYVIDESGRMDKLEISFYDIVVSSGVLEHIHKSIFPDFIQSIADLMKPGGYSSHGINLRDHLQAYDQEVCVKQYLKYSDRSWKRWFENDVQYFNRIQRSQWLNLFHGAGLELIEEEREAEELTDMLVAREYKNYSEDDLKTVDLRLLHKKPLPGVGT